MSKMSDLDITAQNEKREIIQIIEEVLDFIGREYVFVTYQDKRIVENKLNDIISKISTQE